MLRHWQPLMLFLRRAGAPLDNNLMERSLKKAILHRKNTIYYKTENDARVDDLYMRLINTCELNGVYSHAMDQQVVHRVCYLDSFLCQCFVLRG